MPGANTDRLRDRRCLVVGGSRGVGLVATEAFARAGGSVTALARSDSPRSQLEGVTYLACDITQDRDVHRLHDTIHTSGKVDVLVAAAGISLARSQTRSEFERFAETVETNLLGIFRVIDALEDVLNEGASVILVSSINSILGFPDNPGYVASKSALNGLARSLAYDLAPKGIRANSLVLGYFPTDMTKESFQDSTLRAARSARTLMGRWGRLEEIEGPLLFLASDDSSYVTGQSLVVDGGWTVAGL